MGLANQTPHRDVWGARSEWKKSPNHTEPYELFYIFSTNQPFVAVRGWRYVLADRHPNRCRTLRKYSRIITYHYISMPYGPNHTNKFAIQHVCHYHDYVPTVHNCPNELYSIHGDTLVTIKVTVQSEHEPYQSNGDTFDTNPLRIIQTTLHVCTLLQYRPYKTYC